MKNAQLISATVMCIFGCALLVAGMVTPPIGEIDASVLIAYGEILTFAGSLFGIDYKYRSRTTAGAQSKKTAGAQRQKTKDKSQESRVKRQESRVKSQETRDKRLIRKELNHG